MMLVVVLVVASLGLCHGSPVDQLDAKQLHKRLYLANQEPLSPNETIEALKRLQEISDDVAVRNHAQTFLDTNEPEAKNCFVSYYRWLSQEFNEHQYGSASIAPVTSVSNVAKLIQSQIQNLYRFCDAEFKTKTVEAMKKMQPEEMQHMNDLGNSVLKTEYEPEPDHGLGWSHSYSPRVLTRSFLESLGKFVEQKAGRDALLSKSWGKMRLDKEKYKQAYEQFVYKPCERFFDVFSKPLSIGGSLRRLQKFSQIEELLLKEDDICGTAILRSTSEDSFKALAKAQS